jgi:hypothetical protein
VRHWARSWKIKGSQIGDSEARFGNKLIDFAVQIATASNALPSRVETTLPNCNTTIRSAARDIKKAIVTWRADTFRV